jgi:2-oxo-4-hydroxy-4-carboxy-5-ureidoimidazoline decarboxylase
VDLAEVNALGEREFVARLGAVFEHSPWIATKAWQRRPFASVNGIHQAMMAAVLDATRPQQLALVRAHPELAGAEAKAGRLTSDSSGEQARLGFISLSSDEFLKMRELNRRYRDKFGFPCIVALRLHDARTDVIAEMERRLRNDATTELENALEQIGHIARGRLRKLFGEK